MAQRLLLKKRYFDKKNHLVKEECKAYSFDSTFYKEVLNLKVAGKSFCVASVRLSNGTYFPEDFTTDYYKYVTEWPYLKSDTTRYYNVDDAGKYGQTITNYVYDASSLQPNKIVFTNSLGEVVTTMRKFPGNYALPTQANDSNILGIKNLKKFYSLSTVVEQYVIKTNLNNASVTTNGTYTAFNIGQPLPDTLFQLETTTALTDFNPSFVSGQNMIINKYYKPSTIFREYDEYGNVMEQHKKDDAIHSYIWDYYSTYLVAEAANASQKDIAYTSFEADGKGGWTFTGAPSNDNGAVTGKQSYLLSKGSLSKSGLTTTTKYIISYWSKGSGTVTIAGGTQSNVVTGRIVNNWTYHKVTVTGTPVITISGTPYIDELRLFPADAQMVTYTYEPLIGMTSQCDVSNKISYYEYDAFGRLGLIRDDNNNILKKICYNYSGQPENCDCTNFSPNWQNTTTPIRCRLSNNKNTGEQEQEQKDINACSTTYDQVQWVVTGTNLTACPLPCNSSNCSGNDKKCINANCEKGIRINTDSYKSGTKWVCVYHYEWSDGSWSENYFENASAPCMIQ